MNALLKSGSSVILLSVLAGCSAPPETRSGEPREPSAALERPEAPLEQRLALGPVDLAYAGRRGAPLYPPAAAPTPLLRRATEVSVRELPSGGAQELTKQVEEGGEVSLSVQVLDPREDERSYSPPLDPGELQARLGRFLARRLYGRSELPLLQLEGLEPAERRAELCEAADAEACALAAYVEVLEHRVARVEAARETWELSVGVRVTLLHARSGSLLLRRRYRDRELRELVNGRERAYEVLREQAFGRLEAELARDLRDALGEGGEGNEALLRVLRWGTPNTARTFALVLGTNHGEDAEEAAPLRFAEEDARAVGAALVEGGRVPFERGLRLRVGREATLGELRACVAELGRLVLGHDGLLVYFAGYGRRDLDAGGGLLLRDGWLPLSELAELCREALHPSARVVFVLDCSFAGSGGRSYSAGASGGPAGGELEQLLPSDRDWVVWAAAGPGEVALELDGLRPEEEHGLFSYYLLSHLPRGGAGKEEGFTQLREEVASAARSLFRRRQVPARVQRKAQRNPK